LSWRWKLAKLLWRKYLPRISEPICFGLFTSNIAPSACHSIACAFVWSVSICHSFRKNDGASFR
jgi:hypothetical protein